MTADARVTQRLGRGQTSAKKSREDIFFGGARSRARVFDSVDAPLPTVS